jgi:hypothetical protein
MKKQILALPETPAQRIDLPETNMFGGANPNGMYVPMTEDEREVITRLVESKDLQLVIHGWGHLDNPNIIVGDHRIGIRFRLDFNAPAAPVDIYYFDLELRTYSGLTIFREKMPIHNGPAQVCAGLFVELIWDIAVHHLDPKIVKQVKPGAIGLTSRRLDTTTGDATFDGNMKLSETQRNYLAHLEDNFRKQRAEKDKQLLDGMRKQDGK